MEFVRVPFAVTPAALADPYFVLDPMQPLGWATAATAGSGCEVYGMLQPYLTTDAQAGAVYPSLEHWRGAAANLRVGRGVAGLYSYLGQWPHDAAESGTLRLLLELKQPRMLAASKTYRFADRDDGIAEELAGASLPEYPWQLPLTLAVGDAPVDVPFELADDIAGDRRVARVTLSVVADNLCSGDTLELSLNGAPVDSDARPVRRAPALHRGQLLGVAETSLRPPSSGGPGLAMSLAAELAASAKKGSNVLRCCLRGRPAGLGGAVTLHSLEIAVEMSHFPTQALVPAAASGGARL